MNAPLDLLCKQSARLASELPMRQGERLLSIILEFAEDAPEAIQLRHAAMLLRESRSQLDLFAESGEQPGGER
jgi:hypothetical protein